MNEHPGSATSEPGAFIPGDIPPGTSVYIYGAGRGGQMVKRALSAPVVAFIDRDRIGDLEGAPIIPPTSVGAEEWAKSLVIVASQYWPEIIPMLQEKGADRVINAHPWIEERLKEEVRRSDRVRLLRRSAVIAAVVLQILVSFFIFFYSGTP